MNHDNGDHRPDGAKANDGGDVRPGVGSGATVWVGRRTRQIDSEPSNARCALYFPASTEDQHIEGQAREVGVECARRNWEPDKVHSKKARGRARSSGRSMNGSDRRVLSKSFLDAPSRLEPGSVFPGEAIHPGHRHDPGVREARGRLPLPERAIHGNPDRGGQCVRHEGFPSIGYQTSRGVREASAVREGSSRHERTAGGAPKYPVGKAPRASRSRHPRTRPTGCRPPK
jgi:hypothetical protein